MRVKERAQTARRRRTGWTGDRRGNMQVVEVMIVGLLVVAAVVAVSTMNVPVTETEGFKRDNERLTKDSLNAMLHRPSTQTLFGSTLEEYVMEAIAGSPGPLMNYLNKTLPGGAVYNVYLDNHYGPPYPVIKQGEPPREAVAGSVQFVPKLAYTFTIPEFAYYHGDFHMNMYGVPVENGLLLHDEGESIELAVTFQEVDTNGKLTGDVVTLKTYGHTALRQNSQTGRSWPSVSIAHWDEAAEERRYLFDASNTPLYGDRIQTFPPTPLSGDAYNITWTMRLDETAGVKVPKNTVLSMELPRGFDFNASKQEYLQNAMDNDKYWKDWTFEGTVQVGWTITAKTKETFKDEPIWLNVSTNFRTVFDTAYPYYSPITFSMGEGVQGMATILIDTPSTPVTGAYGREAYLSVAKPLINNDTSHWGIAVGNNGDTKIYIHNITMRNPGGDKIVSAVTQTNGWREGSWKADPDTAGMYYWDDLSGAMVAERSQMWLSFDVVGGPTGNNNYRNQDYLDVRNRFNPENGTSTLGNGLGEWEFEKRSWRMGEEWVYRDATAPYDGEGYLGWADEEFRKYWVTGGTTSYNKYLTANTTYQVLPLAFGANAFGGYQGAHVSSRVEIVDQLGQEARDFPLGDRVNIRNDFTALFGKLSDLDSSGVADVSSLTIRSEVYTPELAWKGIPTATYEESASVASQYGSVRALLSDDLNGDGVMDLIAVGGAGLVYGIDGRDGAKFWSIGTGMTILSAALADVDEDGTQELLLGFDSARLGAYDMDPTKSGGDRELWLKELMPLNPFGAGVYIVSDIVRTGLTSAGAPDTVVGVTAVTGEARVLGLDTNRTRAIQVAQHNASALDQLDPAAIMDIARVDWSDSGDPVAHIAFASAKKTVTMLSLPDLERVWVEKLPYLVDGLHVVDLDGDGHEDLVADSTPIDPLETDGRMVFTLTGRSGDFAPKVRDVDGAGGWMTDAAASQNGLFGVADSNLILATRYGSYDPTTQSLMASHPTFDRARGLQVMANGTVYMVSETGAILFNTTEAPFSGYVWDQLYPDPGLTDMYDLHVSPNYPDGGPVYLVNETGSVRQATDTTPTFSEIAHLCTSATVPDAGISCSTLVLHDILIEEDSDGEAERVWILTLDFSSLRLRLHSLDLASLTWTEEGSWVGGSGFSIHQGPDGTVWVGGNGPDNRPLLLEQHDGSWRTHTLWRNTTNAAVSSILVQSDGTAWATSTSGQVWKRAGDRLWTPIHLDGSMSGALHLVETPEGEPWIIGNGFAHAPLAGYVRSSHADFTVSGPTGTGDVTLTLDAEEGHLGGVSETPSRDAVTQVEWYARPAGVPTWTKMTADTTPTGPGVYEITHTGTIACDPACSSIELRAVLNNTWSPDTNPAYTMGGATPAVRSFELTATSPADSRKTTVDVSADDLKGTSTARYSAFHGGAILAADRLPWTYKGDEESGTVGAQARYVDVSATDMVTGAPGSSVAIVEEFDGELQRWVLNGTTGAPESPSDLSSFGFAAGDHVHGILISPIVGDETPDLVAFGTFDDTHGSIRAWDLTDGTDYLTLGDGETNATAIADTGVDGGRRTVAFAGGNGIINSMGGTVAGDAINLRWTSAPSSAQGKATFHYEIPLDAMYGTGIVVSELRFDVKQNGATVTQTARLVDWFNMRPPDRDVPRPPIYTIQIVSWFNEA